MGHHNPSVRPRVECESCSFGIRSLGSSVQSATMKVFAAVLFACLLALSAAQFGFDRRPTVHRHGNGIVEVREPGSVELGFDPRTGRIRAIQRHSREFFATGGFVQNGGGFRGNRMNSNILAALFK